MAQKDLLSRLADRGENVIGKITDLPGAQAVGDALGGVKDRLDDLTKRVRGIEELDKRVAALETRLDELTGGGAPKKRSTARSAAPKKTGAAVKKSATKRSTSSSKRSRPAA